MAPDLRRLASLVMGELVDACVLGITLAYVVAAELVTRALLRRAGERRQVAARAASIQSQRPVGWRCSA